MRTKVITPARGKGVLKYELLLLLMSVLWGSAFVAQQIGMANGLGARTLCGLQSSTA